MHGLQMRLSHAGFQAPAVEPALLTVLAVAYALVLALAILPGNVDVSWLIVVCGSKPRPAELVVRGDPQIRRALENYRTLYQDDALTVLVRSDLKPDNAASVAGR